MNNLLFAKSMKKKMKSTIIRCNINDNLKVDISIDWSMIEIHTDDEEIKLIIITLRTKYMNKKNEWVQSQAKNLL